MVARLRTLPSTVAITLVQPLLWSGFRLKLEAVAYHQRTGQSFFFDATRREILPSTEPSQKNVKILAVFMRKGNAASLCAKVMLHRVQTAFPLFVRSRICYAKWEENLLAGAVLVSSVMAVFLSFEFA